MHIPKQHKLINPSKKWVDAGGSGEIIETFTWIKRVGDSHFIKVFPEFPEAILAAMRGRKLKRAGDLIFYFLNRLMHVRVNGAVEEIGIPATAKEISEATGIQARAVYNNLTILIKLGLLKQPRPRIPVYIVVPEFAYRGVLAKLHRREAHERSLAQLRAEIDAKNKKRKK